MISILEVKLRPIRHQIVSAKILIHHLISWPWFPISSTFCRDGHRILHANFPTLIASTFISAHTSIGQWLLHAALPDAVMSNVVYCSRDVTVIMLMHGDNFQDDLTSTTQLIIVGEDTVYRLIVSSQVLFLHISAILGFHTSK